MPELCPNCNSSPADAPGCLCRRCRDFLEAQEAARQSRAPAPTRERYLVLDVPVPPGKASEVLRETVRAAQKDGYRLHSWDVLRRGSLIDTAPDSLLCVFEEDPSCLPGKCVSIYPRYEEVHGG